MKTSIVNATLINTPVGRFTLTTDVDGVTLEGNDATMYFAREAFAGVVEALNAVRLPRENRAGQPAPSGKKRGRKSNEERARLAAEAAVRETGNNQPAESEAEGDEQN